MAGGCDPAFYNSPISQLGNMTAAELIRHEGAMMSTFFCCSVVTEMCQMDAVMNNYTTAYGTAVLFCNTILDGLKINLGLDF